MTSNVFHHSPILTSFHQSLSPSFPSMGNSVSSEDTSTSPIIEAKSLLSNGDKEGAFGVLKKAADGGNVMACFDVGFMMIQGIGCKKNRKRGFGMIDKGIELKGHEEDMRWKSDGSATEVIGPQSMDLYRLCL